MNSLNKIISTFIILVFTFTINAEIGFGISEVGTLSSLVTSVEFSDEIPTDFQLMQNHPNPFNPTTNIRYAIPVASSVQIKIYNIMGVEVESILSRHQQAGVYNITFDAASLSSGVYFYTVLANQFTDTKKMILLK